MQTGNSLLKPFLLSSCRKKKWFQTSVEERTPDGCFSLVLMLLCAVRYAVLSGRRIDFPRPPGHRCASRFSLPDGRDKRGAASKFARFIRHRRRFAHFHRPAPPFIKAEPCTSFVFGRALYVVRFPKNDSLFVCTGLDFPLSQAPRRHDNMRKGRAAGQAAHCSVNAAMENSVNSMAQSRKSHWHSPKGAFLFWGSLKPRFLFPREREKAVSETRSLIYPADTRHPAAPCPRGTRGSRRHRWRCG